MTETEIDDRDDYTAAIGRQCDMPECEGNCAKDDHKAVRDPEDELLEMCEDCLDDGWRGLVEVLD